jgi:FkbM family methyltransferase
MASGFLNCDGWYLPGWARLPGLRSPEERLLETLSLHGHVVYDVGAFNGAYSMFFSRRVGEQGRVVAFEPRAAGFSVLLNNLDRNQIRNVLPLQIALGAEPGERTIFTLPGMPTTASLAPEARTPLRLASGTARVEKLDVLVGAVPLPPPHFIKIDVEGYECEVLQGARATLIAHRPDLLIEVHGTSARHKCARTRAIRELLQPLGYSLLHAETGTQLGAAGPVPASGHLFARAA